MSVTLTHAPQSAFPSHIKLWSPPSGREREVEETFDLIGSLTLRQGFEQFVLPQLKDDEHPQSTIKEYYNSIEHWERLMPTEPTFAEMDDDLMTMFRRAAKACEGYSPATCNKWFRHVRVILNRMGPRLSNSKKSRRNKRYFSEVPLLEDLTEEDPDPVEMPEKHINAAYTACDVATWPPKSRTGCEPSTWWRTSLVYLVNYGARRTDWLWLERSGMDFDKMTFRFRARKTKKVHHMAFNDAFLSHLELMETVSPYVFTPSKGNKQLYQQWHKIQAAAGIARKGGEPYGFHDLRQTASSLYNDHAPGTAELLLGHSLPREARTTAINYLGSNILKPLWRATRTLKQPAAFMPVLNAYRERVEAEKARQKREADENPLQRKLF